MDVPSRSFSVRHWLILLTAACVLPVWIGALWSLDRAAAAKRQLIEENLLHSARILSRLLDGRLTAIRSALVALATSPSIESGDLEGFHRQARQLVGDFPEADIILADADGAELINSYYSFGSTLPRRSRPDLIGELFQTGKPILRSHFRGAGTGRSLIGVDVPVIRNGKVLFDLGASLPCLQLSADLERAGLPPSWIAAFIDGNGVIIGRNVDAGSAIGRPAMTAVGISEQVFESPTVTGTPTVVAVVPVAGTRWGVAVGVPKSDFDAETAWWRNRVLLGIGGLTLFGTAAALLIGIRIAKAIEALVEPAARIGRGEEIRIPGSPIAETERVATALSQASALLQKRRRDLEESVLRERLSRELAATDGLTGLANRRRFDEMLATEFMRHTRSGADLALLMMDVDHFKAFNDHYGHLAGDDCLRRIARVIEAVVARSGDFAARYGGEEFACILPATPLSGARDIAERIWRGVALLDIPHVLSDAPAHVTISLGVASGPCRVGASPLDLVALADRQLYLAKESGRNRIAVASFAGTGRAMES